MNENTKTMREGVIMEIKGGEVIGRYKDIVMYEVSSTPKMRWWCILREGYILSIYAKKEEAL